MLQLFVWQSLSVSVHRRLRLPGTPVSWTRVGNMFRKYCQKLKHAKNIPKSNWAFDIFLVGLVELFVGLVLWHLPKDPKAKRHLAFPHSGGSCWASHWMRKTDTKFYFCTFVQKSWLRSFPGSAGCSKNTFGIFQVGLVEPARRAIHWMPSMIVERQVLINFSLIPVRVR